MKTTIHSTGIEVDPPLREHIERRTQLSLSRLSERISRIEIYLSDLNGPRGGVDKHCKIEVHLTNLPVAVLDDLDSDMPRLVDRCLARITRLVTKRLERSRELQKLRFSTEAGFA